jgi:hypothetical protein
LKKRTVLFYFLRTANVVFLNKLQTNGIKNIVFFYILIEKQCFGILFWGLKTLLFLLKMVFARGTAVKILFEARKKIVTNGPTHFLGKMGLAQKF